jgi:hypothetical protein
MRGPIGKARRLFQFLLANDPVKVAEANESLFEGLLAAWRNGDFHA